MAIAAGFVTQAGILLAADTLHEGGGYKIYDSKIRWFECPLGVVAFAYGGNVPPAIAAIESCRKQLKDRVKGDLAAVVESILAAEYTKRILNHPKLADDWSLRYRLLVAVRPKRPRGSPALLGATSHVSLSPVSDYECLAPEDSIGHYLIRPSFALGMPEDKVLHLAAYALAAIKVNVVGCGGSTLALAIRHDGTVQEFYADAAVQHIEACQKWFDLVARNAFFQHLDLAATDEDFRRNMEILAKELRLMRQKWQAAVKP